MDASPRELQKQSKSLTASEVGANRPSFVTANRNSTWALGNAGGAEDLPVARHAWGEVQAMAVQTANLRVFVDDQRPRSHEAHLSAPYIEELGQLVERRPAQEASHACDPRIIGDLEQLHGLEKPGSGIQHDHTALNGIAGRTIGGHDLALGFVLCVGH